MIHIAYGPNPETGLPRVARGIISIGNFAFGLVAIGGMVVGGVVLSGVGLGFFILGGISIGMVALGGLSIGAVFVAGGLAISSSYALGALAIGPHAMGVGELTMISFSNSRGYGPISAIIFTFDNCMGYSFSKHHVSFYPVAVNGRYSTF